MLRVAFANINVSGKKTCDNLHLFSQLPNLYCYSVTLVKGCFPFLDYKKSGCSLSERLLDKHSLNLLASNLWSVDSDSDHDYESGIAQRKQFFSSLPAWVRIPALPKLLWANSTEYSVAFLTDLTAADIEHSKKFNVFNFRNVVEGILGLFLRLSL